MKMPFLKTWRWSATMLLTLAAVMSSCKKDDDSPDRLTVTSVMSGSKSLSGATSATDVAVGDNIVVTFSRAVDPATVNSSSVMLKNSAGTVVPAAVTTSGMTVTVNPNMDLSTGMNHTLQIANTVKATDGGTYNGQTFTFKTAGPPTVVAPQANNVKGYWTFNNMVTEMMGSNFTSTPTDITFGTDRHGFANSAAMFNGQTSIIEVDNGSQLISPSMSVSYWMMLDTTNATHNFSMMGMGWFQTMQFEIPRDASSIKQGARFGKNDNTSFTNDMFVNGDGQSGSNGGFVGIEYEKNVTGGMATLFGNKWAHVVYTFDAGSKKRTMYINGERIETDNFTLFPGTNESNTTGHMAMVNPPELLDKFAFGFGKDKTSRFWEDPSTAFGQYSNPDANHFKGMLDDVRFWSSPLTEAEVTKLYNDEK